MELQQAKLDLENWRSQGIVIPVVTKALDQSAAGEAAERVWSRRERYFRSLTWFIFLFILTAACVLIPIVHFILAPLMLLICVVVTFVTYRQRKQILGGIAVCPVCRGEFAIISGYSEWPIVSNCVQCNRAVEISCHC